MTELIKPVRYGILIGLLGLVFGIGWAFWLVLGHERIHASLEKSAVQKEWASMHLFEGEVPHVHKEGEMHKEETKPHIKDQREDSIFELSHTRLRRGHVHAMGLGALTIVISLVIAFTSAPDKIKTITSVAAGLGGIIYPFAWIVMGYRTPALGPNGAEASVTTIAGPGVLLVLIGISSAGIFLLKDVFSRGNK